MTIKELKNKLSHNWDWNDKFNQECLEIFLIKVNKGNTLPTDKNFDDSINYMIEECEMNRIDMEYCGL